MSDDLRARFMAEEGMAMAVRSPRAQAHIAGVVEDAPAPVNLTAWTWPVHDEPGCRFCAGAAHRVETVIWGMPVRLCQAMGWDEWRVVADAPSPDDVEAARLYGEGRWH